jgi:hypothetical protein
MVVKTRRAGLTTNHELINGVHRCLIEIIFKNSPSQKNVWLAVVLYKSTQLQSRTRTANQKLGHAINHLYCGAEWTIGYSLTGNVPRGIITHSHSAPVVKTGRQLIPCPTVAGMRLESWLKRRAKACTSLVVGAMPLCWSGPSRDRAGLAYL